MSDPMIVHITMREIYDAVVRLTGRVDVLIEQRADDRNDIGDHESRIRNLERTKWPLPAVSVLIALGAFSISLLKYL